MRGVDSYYGTEYGTEYTQRRCTLRLAVSLAGSRVERGGVERGGAI
jgi:hypothetical protein